LVEIAPLVSFKKKPSGNITYKSLPTQAQTIVMAIHIHAQEWLTLMSKISKSTLTQRRKHSKKTTRNNNNHKRTKTIDSQHRPLVKGSKRRRARAGGWNL
jgi:hypothetical protein